IRVHMHGLDQVVLHEERVGPLGVDLGLRTEKAHVNMRCMASSMTNECSSISGTTKNFTQPSFVLANLLGVVAEKRLNTAVDQDELDVSFSDQGADQTPSSLKVQSR